MSVFCGLATLITLFCGFLWENIISIKLKQVTTMQWDWEEKISHIRGTMNVHDQQINLIYEKQCVQHRTLSNLSANIVSLQTTLLHHSKALTLMTEEIAKTCKSLQNIGVKGCPERECPTYMV